MEGFEDGLPFVVTGGLGADAAGGRFARMPSEHGGERLAEERSLVAHRGGDDGGVFLPAAHVGVAFVEGGGLATHGNDATID